MNLLFAGIVVLAIFLLSNFIANRSERKRHARRRVLAPKEK